MEILLITIMALTLAAACVIFFSLVRGILKSWLNKQKGTCSVRTVLKPDLEKFNCMAQLSTDGQNSEEIIRLKICGKIFSLDEMQQTSAKILISDITDGVYKSKSVYSSVDQWSMKNSGLFCLKTRLGTLHDSVTIISDWMKIAEIPVESLILPRKGKRLLEMRVSIFSHNNNQEIVYGDCRILYENNVFGYLDIEEKTLKANKIALPAALTIAARGNHEISEKQTRILDTWARKNARQSANSLKIRNFINRKISRLGFISQAVTHKTCIHISKNCDLATRCNILKLFLQIIAAGDKTSDRQVELLKDIAAWLDIHPERLRAMIEETRPFSMHKVKDIEICLGITDQMSGEQVQKQLSREYRKWNSRVINTNAKIREEAKGMLDLIGETKKHLSLPARQQS